MRFFNFYVGLWAVLIGFSASSFAAGEICMAIDKTVQPCDSDKIKTDETYILSNLKIAEDPAGFSVELKVETAGDITPTILGYLQDYAQANACNVRVLVFKDLINGLMGSMNRDLGLQDVGASNKASSEFTKEGNKMLVLTGKQAECIEVLNFKLPLTTVQPTGIIKSSCSSK